MDNGRKNMKKVNFASNSKIMESGSFRKSSNKSYVSDKDYSRSGETPDHDISKAAIKINSSTTRMKMPPVTSKN